MIETILRSRIALLDMSTSNLHHQHASLNAADETSAVSQVALQKAARQLYILALSNIYLLRVNKNNKFTLS